MLNDSNRPYKLPQDNNPENRRRAFYMVIALAVVLTTIPLIFLVLRGWLDGNKSAEPAADSQPLPVAAPISAEQPPPMIVEPPPPTNTVPSPVAAPVPAVAPPDTSVIAPAPPVATPAANPVVAETPASTVAPPVATPAPDAVVPDAAPVATPPQPPIAEPAPVVAKPPAPVVQPKPVAEPKKPTFTPLSTADRAKLSAANSSARQSSSASVKIVQPGADYNKKLYSFVRSQWLPPAPSEIGNAKLKAEILVEVAPDGTIKSARQSRASGNRKMDATVSSLAARLLNRKAPAPGNGTVKVKIELLCK